MHLAVVCEGAATLSEVIAALLAFKMAFGETIAMKIISAAAFSLTSCLCYTTSSWVHNGFVADMRCLFYVATT